MIRKVHLYWGQQDCRQRWQGMRAASAEDGTPRGGARTVNGFQPTATKQNRAEKIIFGTGIKYRFVSTLIELDRSVN